MLSFSSSFLFALLLCALNASFAQESLAGTSKLRKRDTCPFTVKAYTGCYQTGNDEFTDGPYYDDDGVYDADVCACMCGKLGYGYAAMISSTDCYCGSSYGLYGTSTDCTVECPDDNTEFCGGNDGSVASVYQTNVGCDPPCGANKTCTRFGLFYWCTPDCDFTASLDYSLPCGSTGNVTLSVNGGSIHNNAFNLSVDGGAISNHTLNTSFSYTFAVGQSHNFTLSNIFNCSITKSLTLPTPSQPYTMDTPILIFDVATLQLSIMWYKLVYPSRTGGLNLQRYVLQYRYHCVNGTYSNWAMLNATDSSDSVKIGFEYGLEYQARVWAENCLGAGGVSNIITLQAPPSPFTPYISKILPASGVSTTGGIITISGGYFTSLPSLFVGGVAKTPSSRSDQSIVVTLDAGVGTLDFTVQSNANYSCQVLTSPDYYWSYSAPSITNVSTLSNAGGVFTITGVNFGASGNLSVAIDSILCSSCSIATSHTQIVCGACPAGNGDDHLLVVSVAGLVSSGFPFSYAICDPMCVYGECVGYNVCSCEDGYGGSDCSKVRVCPETQAFSQSTCGECTTNGATCCVLKP